MEKMNGKTRVRYIDYFKAISIILVVLGHIDYANQDIKAWIYAFHMPAFFFVSGVFLKNDRDQRWADGARYIWKRLQCLMIPYLLYALLYANLSPKNFLRILYGSYTTLSSAGSLTSLWFLPALLVSLAMFAAARCLLKKRFRLTAKLVLTVLAFLIACFLPRMKHGYPWCVDVSFSAFGFLLLGNLSFPLLQRFRTAVSRGGAGIALGIAVLAVGFAGTLLYHLNTAVHHVVMAKALYGNFLLFLIATLPGIVFTIALSILADRLLPSMRHDPLFYVGQHTMVIFATQKPIISLFQKLFSFASLPAAAQLIITCVGTTACCCLLALLVDRYLPILNGQISRKP